MEGKKIINESGVVAIETIIPGIKPPFPLEPRESYRPIRPADVAAEIRGGLQRNSELRKFFAPFSNQVVVEIGPGELLTGYEVALLSGARAYIGVEPYVFVDNLQKFLEQAENFTSHHSLPQIARLAVKADALSFLRRLPDKSVSIFASQLESVMKKEYEIDVIKEIQRVLHPQGALIQYDSHFNLDPNLFTYNLVDPKLAENLALSWQLKKYQSKT